MNTKLMSNNITRQSFRVTPQFYSVIYQFIDDYDLYKGRFK